MNSPDKIYSVSRLSRTIRRLLEDGIPKLWVEGEVSNFKLHGSGHRYFTLKDANAQIPCVMWRTRQAPDFVLSDGQLVRLFGRVTVWEQGGRYQIDVESILPAGIGSLQAAFEELKRNLAGEGLFDLERKKRLPRFPSAIGIATSPTGAAIRDMVWGFSHRYPPAELYLLPVAVQGEDAALQIARAIQFFNAIKLVDIIVIGRGGGSLEDLWAFNEEAVVREIAASVLPVVSAVGHEVDVSLSDLAADVRAPTPTAAAEICVPDREDLQANLIERDRMFRRSLGRNLATWKERLESISRGYGFRRITGRIGDERLRLDELERRLGQSLDRRVEEKRSGMNALGLQLAALSPDGTLSRGFCVARLSDGAIVRRSKDLRLEDELQLQFFQGRAGVSVKEISNDH